MNNAIQSDLFASFYLLRPVIAVVIPCDKKFPCGMASSIYRVFHVAISREINWRTTTYWC